MATMITQVGTLADAKRFVDANPRMRAVDWHMLQMMFDGAELDELIAYVDERDVEITVSGEVVR